MILLPRQYPVKPGFRNKLTFHSLKPFIQVVENTPSLSVNAGGGNVHPNCGEYPYF